MNIVAATQPWWEDWDKVKWIGVWIFWLIIIIVSILKD